MAGRADGQGICAAGLAVTAVIALSDNSTAEEVYSSVVMESVLWGIGSGSNSSSS